MVDDSPESARPAGNPLRVEMLSAFCIVLYLHVLISDDIATSSAASDLATTPKKAKVTGTAAPFKWDSKSCSEL